jgi:FkbM family methyltransferase
MTEQRIIMTDDTGKTVELQAPTIRGLQYLGAGVCHHARMTDTLKLIGVRDPKLVVDVGANIGAYSIGYSLAWPDCKILAVEPVAQNLKFLEYNTQYFPNIEIVPVAASDKSGFATMEMPLPEQLPDHTEVDGRKDYAIMSLHGKSGIHRQQVETRTLDEIIGADPVGFIKIDVESHEYYALKGAESVLTHQRPGVTVETVVVNQKMSGHKVEDLYFLMAQHRYARITRINIDDYFMAA